MPPPATAAIFTTPTELFTEDTDDWLDDDERLEDKLLELTDDELLERDEDTLLEEEAPTGVAFKVFETTLVP